MSTSTESPILAGAPGACCVQGVKHTGVPIGRVETIAGVETYISDPPANTTGPTKIILYFADIFGPLFNNAKLLQDFFASHGFHVLGPDYFFGDTISVHTDDPEHPDPNFDMNAWFDKVRKIAAEATPPWIDAVREKYGTDAKYYAVGYCFGAPYTLDLASTDSVIASAIAHPAFVNEDNFKKLKKPLLISCAETDHLFPAESRRRVEDILAELKATYHVQVFSGVVHGFATRGDPTVENTRWAKEESARSVINWFLRFSS
ncbi:hypothetical protein M413DRAFT_272676 [Hebeloma cylindrosporum]|uniref:Dienelactone hydrolase domain-containing protein n=1 Tax=Hebeloma cylindrosporum TaxID=76867 RepID=A0A0C2YBU2_HEBCY|nr:hypothetical protein M413DRAFT_272676 [Hebeloma cylindrosporum h7]